MPFMNTAKSNNYVNIKYFSNFIGFLFYKKYGYHLLKWKMAQNIYP